MRKVLILLAVFSFFIITSCSSQQPSTINQANNGVLNIAKNDFSKNELIHLNGEWEFYWKQLLEPKDFENDAVAPSFSNLPKLWNETIYNDEQLSGDGFATYKLSIELNESERNTLKAIYIPYFHTAYKIWVNGELLGGNGVVGKTKDTMVPQYFPKAYMFKVDKTEIDIVIQASNYYHRKGGLRKEIIFGNAQDVLNFKEQKIGLNIFLFGSFLAIGLYHIVIYWNRRSEKAELFLSLFSFIIAFRSLLVDQMCILQILPNFNFIIQLKLEYLTIYLSFLFGLLFLREMYPKETFEKFIKFSVAICSVFSINTIFGSAKFFTNSQIVFNVFEVIFILYFAFVLVFALVKKREMALISCITGMIFLLTIINDLLLYEGVIKTTDLSAFGFLIFIFSQALNLSFKYARSFNKIEILSKRMKKLNLTLEEKVYERTKELEKANKLLQELSYKDGLTNVFNRRYFDERFEQELKLASNLNKPLTLMLLDIDYFKEYNDKYGHQLGDDALKQVAATLQESLPENSYVSRYGGEEFAIVLPHINLMEAKELGKQLNRIIEMLKIPHLGSKVSKFVTISAGIVTKSNVSVLNISDMISEADKALYHSKMNGRNQVTNKMM